jgi:ribosome modulation factor
MKRQKRDKREINFQGHILKVTTQALQGVQNQTSGARYECLGGGRDAVGDRIIGLEIR